jgi:hypothetical protein
MNNLFFLLLTPCSQEDFHRNFGGKHCIYFSGGKVSLGRKPARIRKQAWKNHDKINLG